MNEYIISLITAIAGAIGGWYATDRKARGKVEAARLEAQATEASEGTKLEALKNDITEDVIRRLHKELDRVYAQKDELEETLAAVRLERDEARDQRDDAQEERDEAVRQRDAAQSRISDLEVKVGALEDRMAQLSEPHDLS